MIPANKPPGTPRHNANGWSGAPPERPPTETEPHKGRSQAREACGGVGGRVWWGKIEENMT